MLVPGVWVEDATEALELAVEADGADPKLLAPVRLSIYEMAAIPPKARTAEKLSRWDVLIYSVYAPRPYGLTKQSKRCLIAV